MKKLFFKKSYFPSHEENLMKNEGDTINARNSFLKNKFINLDQLLKSRYMWMNKYLNNTQKIIEVGAGAGFSEFYLKPSVILTDVVKNDWIHEKVDAISMPYEDSSIDVVIASHCIHHMYSPMKFFKECKRVLKKDGLILIQEINTSFLMRLLLNLNKHEGYSYEVNVFDENEIANNPNDIWSANCAIPELLFSNTKKFEENIPYFKILKNHLNECFIFPLSGGVIAKRKMFKIPKFLFPIIKLIDKILIYCLPSIFALGRSTVLQK